MIQVNIASMYSIILESVSYSFTNQYLNVQILQVLIDSEMIVALQDNTLKLLPYDNSANHRIIGIQ